MNNRIVNILGLNPNRWSWGVIFIVFSISAAFAQEGARFSKDIISPQNKNGADISDVKYYAKKGNSAAQFKLGEYYKLGLGVRQSYTEAAKWYLRAAEQDEPMAFRVLAAMYCLGLGVEQDNAMMWYYFEETHFHIGVFWQDYYDDVAWQDIRSYIPYNDYMGAETAIRECLSHANAAYHDPMLHYEAVTYYMHAARMGNAEAMKIIAEHYLEQSEYAAKRISEAGTSRYSRSEIEECSVKARLFKQQSEKWYGRFVAKNSKYR